MRHSLITWERRNYPTEGPDVEHQHGLHVTVDPSLVGGGPTTHRHKGGDRPHRHVHRIVERKRRETVIADEYQEESTSG